MLRYSGQKFEKWDKRTLSFEVNNLRHGTRECYLYKLLPLSLNWCEIVTKVSIQDSKSLQRSRSLHDEPERGRTKILGYGTFY